MYLNEHRQNDVLENKLYSINSIRDRNICLLIYLCGLKTNEIISLNVEDIKQNYVILGNGSKRELDNNLQKSLVNLIKNKSSTHPVFSANCVTRLTYRRVQQIVKENTGYNVRDLRKLGIERVIYSKKNSAQLLCEVTNKNILSYHDINDLILEAESPRDEALFRLISETGMTIGQALSLTRCDIIDSKINIPNTDSRFMKSQKTCEISDYLSSLLNAVAGEEYIFASSRGDNLSARRAQQIFSKYSETIGKKVTPSAIKNTSAIRKVLSSLHKFDYGGGDAS